MMDCKSACGNTLFLAPCSLARRLRLRYNPGLVMLLFVYYIVFLFCVSFSFP